MTAAVGVGGEGVKGKGGGGDVAGPIFNVSYGADKAVGVGCRGFAVCGGAGELLHATARTKRAISIFVATPHGWRRVMLVRSFFCFCYCYCYLLILPCFR